MNKKHIKLVLSAAILTALSCASVGNAATTQANESMTSPDLPLVLVQSQRYDQYAGNMINRSSRVGVLGNVDFMKAPVNTISFTKDVLDTSGQSGREFFDVVTRHPSVQVGGCSTDNNVELQIRGMAYSSYDVLVDGVAGLMPMGSHALNWVERVEVTAGGNATLNGVVPYRSTTGYVNVVPKRAVDEDTLSFSEGFSGKSIHTHTLDVGSRFGDNKEWGVRVNGMLSKGDTSISREHIQHDNLFLSIDRRGEDSNTSLLVGYEYVKHTGMPEMIKIGSHWGKEITKLPDANKVIDNFMPAWSELSRTRKVALFQHEQKINDAWAAYVKWGYQGIDYPGYLDKKPEMLNDKGDYTATINGDESQTQFFRHNLSVGVRGELTHGDTTHQVTIGYDRITNMNIWSNGKGGTKAELKDGNVYSDKPLDTFEKPQVAPAHYYVGSHDAYYSRYITDYISTDNDRWHILVGARHQTIKTTAYVKSTVLPVLAMVYELSPQTSLYGSFGETMDTATAPKDAKNARAILAPIRTKQYEVGAKFDFGDFGTTVSAFVAKKPQGLYDAAKVFSMDGEVEHRGVEINAFGKLSDSVSVQGGVMFLTTDQKKMTNPQLNGKKAYGTSPFAATLGVAWQTPIEGLTLNGRLMHVGESYSDAMNLIKVPAWTRVDVGASYAVKRGDHNYRFNAMVYNVFDKHYWSTAVVRWGEGHIMLNPGRNFTASLSIDF